MVRKVCLTENDIARLIMETVSEIEAMHGSPSREIVTGKFRKSKVGYLGPGIYFTDTHSRAKHYAKKYDGHGAIYTVEIDLVNPLILTSDNCTKEFLDKVYRKESVYLNRSNKQSFNTYIITSKDIKKLLSLGYDGVKYTYGGETDYVVYDNSKIRILRQEDINENIGYHGGDGKKSEHFVQMMNGNRDTGHFGTGTYFVGNKDNLNTIGYGNRLIKIIQCDGYNLLKINDDELGMMLHKALKYLNNNAFIDAVNGEINHDELKKQCRIIGIIALNPQDFNEANICKEKVYRICLDILNEYSEYYKANPNLSESDRVSISTQVMKSLGYDGIDVRGCQELDNTEFGSVIYNLKESNRNIILTEKDIKSLVYESVNELIRNELGQEYRGLVKADICNVPKTLYHTSQTENRDSILRKGLLASSMYIDDWWSYEDEATELPNAVFLSELGSLYNIHCDVFEVDVSMLNPDKLYIDPSDDMENAYCYIDNIPPEAVRLYKPFE